MENFYQVFGFVAALCAGVIILSVFFTLTGYFKRRIQGTEIIKMKGFIRDGKLINVHAAGGKSVLGVRLLGFTETGHGKPGIPHQLGGMLVLETSQGSRILLRADSIRMIEEIESAA